MTDGSSAALFTTRIFSLLSPGPRPRHCCLGPGSLQTLGSHWGRVLPSPAAAQSRWGSTLQSFGSFWFWQLCFEFNFFVVNIRVSEQDIHSYIFCWCTEMKIKQSNTKHHRKRQTSNIILFYFYTYVYVMFDWDEQRMNSTATVSMILSTTCSCDHDDLRLLIMIIYAIILRGLHPAPSICI